MQFSVRFLILISLCAASYASQIPTTTKVPEVSTTKPETFVDNKTREKRQLYVPTTQPVYFDGPVQQPGLLGGGQNIPIIGTLVSGLPMLPVQNLLGGLTGTLGNLGGSLGNLGNFGGLGNLGGLGNFGGSHTPVCPANHKHSCHCEPLIPLKPLGTRQNFNRDIVEILDQSIKNIEDGSTESILRLSNGVIMYQKTNNQALKNIDGYYSLRVAQDRYLTIYYTVDGMDYTVKANVEPEPPQTSFQIDAAQQNLIGSF